ncbi:MAG: alcohol dehydrogenase catalytic domain-containing protein [Proteobacteria bacterium]|nr:alcohol dehydrogenase catalytic domain-containing protein [Pseudomonadota bacterium]
MLAYVYNGNGVIKREVPIPEIRPNDVLVKLDRVSICGSDFHIFSNDNWAKETITKGIVVGHEGCGHVEKVGAEVPEIKVGDFVALESHYACPSCEKKGKTADDCPHYGIIGVHGTSSREERRTVGGVFAEYVAVPHYCCHRISQSISQQVSASLLEPAGNSWEILRFLRKRGMPQTLAIHGCGPHSLNMQLFARYAGVKNIVAFETNPSRIEFASEFGAAHHVLDPTKISHSEIIEIVGGDGFDVAIDMVGSIEVVEACKNEVVDKGLVILFGLPTVEANVAPSLSFGKMIFGNEMHRMQSADKSYLVRGFTGRTKETWRELIAALEKSEFLRDKLSMPLGTIGTLNELDNFIKNQPKHFLKIGMNCSV